MNAKLRFLATAVACTFSTAACAQQQAKPTPVEITQVPIEAVELDRPALWKVADEDTTIYLFGTVHTLPENVDWESGAVTEALSSADELVSEIDLTPESMAQIPLVAARMGVFTDGRTLRGIMDEQERARFEIALAEIGLTPRQIAELDVLEPWLAAIQLANLAYQRAGMSPEHGVEKVLEETVGPNTQRTALETIEEQFGMFDSLPLDAQVDYLIETAEQFDDFEPFLAGLLASWAKGNIEKLASDLNQAMEGNDRLAQALLYSRNRSWAEWIDTRLDTPGTVFMAVGAGHLAGDDSVQDALAMRGIQSVRIQ